MRIISSITIALVLFLAGCTMAPKYQRPEAPVAGSWPEVPGNAQPANIASNTPAAELGWREFFSDPRLQALVDLALTNNRDLRVAILNVDLARAQYRVQRSELFPRIDASAGGSRQRIPADLARADRSVTSTEYSVGAGVAAYELDLFGRVRSLKQDALNRYLATEQARRSAHILLVAEVANAYLAERQLHEQLEVARQTLKAVEASFELNQRTFQEGIISELDLRTAETQVQATRANLASLTRELHQVQNAIVLLVGQPLPADLPPARTLSDQDLSIQVPAGLPSELLQRRPDILAAEYQLKAANANIGAARAAFFPRILLTGSAGKASVSLEDLFDWSQNTWRFAPQITVPIFTGGANRANLDAAKVRKLIEVANYERAIQSGFREVADALAASTILNEEIAAREALVKAEEQRFELAQMRYRNGVDSYLNVLTAQRDLYAAQQSLIAARTGRLTSLVTLYRALGGGWNETTRQVTQNKPGAEFRHSGDL